MTRHDIQVQWYRFLYYCVSQPLSFFTWKYGSRLANWVNVRWYKLEPGY